MKKNQDSALPETLLIEESDRLSEKIQALQKLLTQNPNLRVQDILFPGPDSHELQVREAMFKIFSHVGEIIGRNSPQAIEADLILFLERNRESLNYDPINRNPIVHLEYIEQSIPDSDMKSKVWFMRIYRQVMRPFYQVLGTWRSRGVDNGRIRL